jgi:hypothetical protein
MISFNVLFLPDLRLFGTSSSIIIIIPIPPPPSSSLDFPFAFPSVFGTTDRMLSHHYHYHHHRLVPSFGRSWLVASSLHTIHTFARCFAEQAKLKLFS